MKKIEIWKVTRVEGSYVSCTSYSGRELDFLKSDLPEESFEIGNKVAIKCNKGSYSLLEKVSDLISRRPKAVIALAQKYL